MRVNISPIEVECLRRLDRAYRVHCYYKQNPDKQPGTFSQWALALKAVNNG